jgi:hypothetical protein
MGLVIQELFPIDKDRCVNFCVWFQQLVVQDPGNLYLIFIDKDWFDLSR